MHSSRVPESSYNSAAAVVLEYRQVSNTCVIQPQRAALYRLIRV